MADHSEIIAEFIKWVKDSNRPASVLLIVSGAMLLLPTSWLAWLGMTTWVQNYKPWVVLLFSCSLVWLATYPFVVWQGRYKIRQRLDNLGKDERYLLSLFVRSDSAVHCVSHRDSPSATPLIREKILFDTGNCDGGRNPYIAIDSWVFQYLKKHKKVVGVD